MLRTAVMDIEARAIPETDVGAARRLAAEAWEVALTNPARADALTREAESRAPDDPLASARILRNRAYRMLFVGEITEALRLAERAERAFEELGETLDLASAIDIQSHVFEFTGDYARALDRSLVSLRLAEQVGDERQMAWAYANVGSIELGTGDRSRATKYFDRALEIFRRQGYRAGESRVLSRLADIARERGDEEAAFRYACQSHEIGAELGLPLLVGRSLEHIGKLCLSRGDHAEARRHFDAALELWAREGMRAAIAEAHYLLAQVDLAQGLETEACARLEGAKSQLVGLGDHALGFRIEALHSEALERTGRYREALEAARKAHRWERRAFDDESRVRLRKLQTRMEVDRAERDAEIHRLKYVELERMQLQLVESEKMAILGRVAAGVAHEVNTPSGVLKSHVQLGRRIVDRLSARAEAAAADPELARWATALGASFDSAEDAAERIARIVEDLTRYAELDRSDVREGDLVEALQTVLRLIRARLPEGVTLSTDLQPLPRFRGHIGPLQQALTSMLLFASEHACCPAPLRVFSRRGDDTLELGVEFVGEALSVEAADSLFEIGFDRQRTVQFRLGLPTARATARQHDGDLAWESDGNLHRLVLRLPCPESSATPARE